jgi:hypothetical protein
MRLASTNPHSDFAWNDPAYSRIVHDTDIATAQLELYRLRLVALEVDASEPC